ncbi:MAG: hypothetical protein A2504_07155 [Bdellovibrionales bacterium RIFOXYD12_FULL_39_22]|nr:MAG: hypothetical protein A2385_05370 [Bdellovibrionales bacterium RIFOXYB1_FULL_39_21]OFZ44351.1 MAG: hypothetical protein A2485_16150 [Bdellovibrionales bacterium RIFOXYC12_FULL_39_17]OFZ49206.1 MAG: hypothetical protein A2404_16090 [Bdellovibrionales bacterium RIFOXYC1_FULL_39_130]OFZ71746.1 MAG: hypothetical protein A2451_11155 [Bdellovibrionales bacterium RIFOXYC2_FULL_39_8]OFZ77014.1 MAG: hypothetical protein A2560_11175 [Bdellovibrionales bacterium RIFOXYD1_FULL_39_84]OFZ95227.1 MAG:
MQGPKLIKHSIITILLTFITLALAQSNSATPSAKVSPIRPPENEIDYVRKIKDEISKIKTLSPENYFNEIDRIREEVVERYLDHKKMVCNGEFSSIILAYDSKGNKAPTINSETVLSNTPTALTKEEKIACWMELKSFQIEFINNMYDARRKYLEYIHNQRLQELKTNKNIAIKSLESSIMKYSKQSVSGGGGRANLSPVPLGQQSTPIPSSEIVH